MIDSPREHGLFLLSDMDWQDCVRSIRLEVGPYHGWGGRHNCPFVVELDAKPLAALAESAALGSRVYEFMTIHRPGDILNYLQVCLTDIDRDIEESVRSRQRWRLGHSEGRQAADTLPFCEFDSLFYWDGDDTTPQAGTWLRFRDRPFWRARMSELLAVVRRAQQRLRQNDDSLIQYEIAMLDSGTHWRLFRADINRQCLPDRQIPFKTTLPDALFTLVASLIDRETVQSVSCPLQDYWLWKLLVSEQVRRMGSSGRAPQQAFGLSGPDDGLPHVVAKDWGGEVHIPYEGMCEGDLIIKPRWRNFFPERGGNDGKLSDAMSGAACHYVLTDTDYGELGCAERSLSGDWVLYESKRTYQPCNPFRN